MVFELQARNVPLFPHLCFTPFYYLFIYYSTYYYHIHSTHIPIHTSNTFYKLRNSFSIPPCKTHIAYQVNSLHPMGEQTNPILAQFFLYHIWNKLILLEISILIPILKFLKRIFTHTPNSIFKRRYSSLLSPNPTCFRSSLQRRVFSSRNFLEVSIHLSAWTPSRSILLSNPIQQLQRARPRNQRPIHLRLAGSAEIRERRIRQTRVKRAAGLVVFLRAAFENGSVQRMRLNELVGASRLRIDGFSRVENAVVENERLRIGEVILRLAGAFRDIKEIGDDRHVLSFGRHQEENAHHAPNLPTKSNFAANLMPQKRAAHNLNRQNIVLRRFSAMNHAMLFSPTLFGSPRPLPETRYA